MPENRSTNLSLCEEAKRVFLPNYRPAPLVLERGEGVYVWDVDGNRYLDMVAGIAVSALGHAHPRLVQAIREQAGRILHTSNLYLNRPSIELAGRLTKRCFAEGVYFCNSGAEANEGAIKLARRAAYRKGEKDRSGIVSFEGSFHGRTLGALTATAQPKYHEGFGPMPGGFTYLPLGDVELLKSNVDSKTAAVIIEPIQGEGGVREPPAGFLAACRSICDAAGALLIFDEVQVGVGRTGRMFCHEHDGVTPDIMSLAKGLGGGLPLGAMVTTRAIGDALEFGTHATTFGGNPVACAAGNVVMEVLGEPGFLDRVRDLGLALARGLARIGEKRGVFREVRGRGLLLGAVLSEKAPFDAKALVEACRARHVLVHIAGPNVLRLAPPLVITAPQVEEALSVIDDAARSLG